MAVGSVETGRHKKNRIVIYDPNSLEEGFEAPELFVIRLKRLP